jgi:oligoribonuclease
MKLFWTDLETTGLDPAKDSILEIAVLEADLSAPFDWTTRLHTPLRWKGDPASLQVKVRTMHETSGLLAACSEEATTLADVEAELLEVIPEVEDYGERPTLAGSSVHFDLSFLRVHMPRLAARFSHRVYDVSAVKIFCRSLGMPKDLVPRAEAHRALADVEESIRHARACACWFMSSDFRAKHRSVGEGALAGDLTPQELVGSALDCMFEMGRQAGIASCVTRKVEKP